jgi:hypothetical protein
MVQRTVIVLVACFALLSSCRSRGAQEKTAQPQVRKPAVAGSFYPPDSLELSAMVDDYLGKAEKRDLTGNLVALWVPHAGYPFSGSVAACAFKQLENRKYETVIIVGPSHHVAFSGISISDRGFCRTPLGLVPIDSVIARQLEAANKSFYYRPEVDTVEHCVEVELPFLQKTLGAFKVVPVIFGQVSAQDISDFADALTGALGTEGRLLIVSADLSHYHPYNTAETLDKTGLAAVQSLNAAEFADKINEQRTEIDAPGAAMAMITAVKALGAEKATLLKYANSGDVTGDKSKVVGYAALAVTVPEWVGTSLTRADQKELLDIARKSIEAVVQGKKPPVSHPQDPILERNCGAFVTITKGGGELRGCIGYILPIMPLYTAVSQAGISAATKDMRFPPVSPGELKDLELEISVLAAPKLISDTTEIVVGRDGLIMRAGSRSGLLLPQVASSRNWNRLTFLEETCAKAGLPADAWKSGAQIYTFRALVFGEPLKAR